MTFLRQIRRLLLMLSAGLLLAFGLYLWALTPLTPPQDATPLSIKPGMSLIQVANLLERKGVIRSALFFRLLARQRGEESAIQAGSYLFVTPAGPERVLDRLVAGDVVQIKVTIPEGFSLQQIAARLAEAGVTDAARLMEVANNPQFSAGFGLAAPGLEGYLFPETYRFAPGISDTELLAMMVDEFKRQYALLQHMLEDKLPLDQHQLVTLASIIQKETGLEEEMPLISAVFHNRLRLKIPLQTDPTVIYGIENFNGNLTRADLLRASPYNTYLNRGLPPGPIASPGFKALQAAARPADSTYLYFVSRGDGSHQFSATLKEHNQAVIKYQLRRGR